MAFAGEEAASAGVEGLIIFHDGDGGLNRIESGGAFFQQRVAGSKSAGYALSMRLDQIVRDVPGAAMNGEDGCNFEAHGIYCSG